MLNLIISYINKTNGNVIWDEFVIKSLDISDNIIMIHPSIWRKPFGKTSKIKNILTEFKKYDLSYLKINSLSDGKKYFNAGTRFDYYLLQKNIKNRNKTLIIDENDVPILIDIRDCNFIPNKNIKEVYEYLSKENDNFKVIYNSMYHAVNKELISDVKDDVHIYPVVHSTPKSGVIYKYSSYNNKGHYGIPKVIFGESGTYNALVDMKGEYAMTQCAIGIIIDSEEMGNDIVDFLKSDNFKKFMEACSWSNFRIDANILKYLSYKNIKKKIKWRTT